ncbi:branched-chain amino acid ABC transporter permease [Castellaniella sp. S9]|uniref:branched-chain amino acid ABC transporter permease n=1 Tax=Castellaniella sp. S9 TaxID=2993652 RepID=UPI0022B4A09E|nr:branched-chain amino acid ABC transporter permease [Castellaniella sp. S9]
MRTSDRTPLAIVVITILLAAGVLVFPDWLSATVVTVIAKALVVVGVVVLMRSALVSFGQGLYYCIGGYVVGLGGHMLNITDMLGLIVLAAFVGLICGCVLGLLMSRYRDIFFAMFSLALAMILYGLLSRSQALGSTDGFNVVPPTLLGFELSHQQANLALYLITCAVAATIAYAMHRYFQSPLGYAGRAIADNEIRVEYLGFSPSRVLYGNYVIASVLAAVGGAVMALNYGHVGPDMAYWTQSGEFLFIGLMGGSGNVLASFLGSAVFETVRTYALELAPDAWHLILGTVLVLIVCFLPGGLWSLIRPTPSSRTSDTAKELA